MSARAQEAKAPPLPLRVGQFEAEIAGGLWLRQKRWDLKREIYSQLLEGLHDSRRALLGMRRMAPESAGFKKADERLGRAVDLGARARAVGSILLTPAARAATETLASEWDRIALGVQGKSPTQGQIDEFLERVNTAIRSLEQGARSDLNQDLVPGVPGSEE